MKKLALLLLLPILLGMLWIAAYSSDISYEKLDKLYANSASKFIDMGDGVIAHWRDQGDLNKLPLVLVHGYASSLYTWEPWVALFRQEYRLVSVDLPGHGLTRTPSAYRPSMEGYADFVANFMERIGLGKATIVGSSMGGNAAWMLALRHPERAAALVLIGASGWPESEKGNQSKPLAFTLLSNPVLAPLIRDLDNTAMVRNGLKSAFENEALADETMVKRFVDFSRAPNHRSTLTAIMLSYADRDFATQEKLAVIDTPTLIMHGRKDKLVPVASAELFSKAIRGSQCVIYDGVGHLPQEEIPERSGADMGRFIRKVVPRSQ